MLKLRQLCAAGLLARGYSNVHTARSCSIGRATLYRWKASPEFQAELAARRRDALAGVHSYLQALSQAAAAQARLDAAASPVARSYVAPESLTPMPAQP